MKRLTALIVFLCPAMAWATIFLVMRTGTADAANVFTGDAACEAVWRLESGALTTDSSGNGNTLTNDGVAASGTYKEGSYSGDFEYDETDSLLISDASLSSGFPLKTGDTTKDISVCFWFRLESHPASTYLFSKFDLTTNKASFGILVTSALKIGHNIGYNYGASYEVNWDTGTLSDGVWYHVGATYDDSSKAWTMRVWNGTTSAIVANLSGTKTNNISVTSASVLIGACQEGAAAWTDGLIDEVVVFSRVLSTAEIDSIRGGTFGASGGSEHRRIIASAGGG